MTETTPAALPEDMAPAAAIKAGLDQDDTLIYLDSTADVAVGVVVDEASDAMVPVGYADEPGVWWMSVDEARELHRQLGEALARVPDVEGVVQALAGGE